MFYKGQGFRFVLFIANQVPAFWIVIQTTCVPDIWRMSLLVYLAR